MVKFLLERPIAVLMAFTACFIIGLVTYFTLPVSLLPDIAIPQITVQVSGENSSARELENTVVTPVRRQLLQVTGLREIKSETRDGAGIIRMEFDFGVNTDLAFIEVNEKIDAAMNSLPKEATRPKAIKASATDIPVLYLNLTLKNDLPYEDTDEQRFLTLCELAENVVKRRIEQLPEVAMADITGVPGRMLRIVPDAEKLAITGITIEDIENTLSANNVEPGSMLVRDGYYEYNIRIATLLRTPEDVENIYLRKGDRILQLKEICKVAVVPQKEQGMSVAGAKENSPAILEQRQNVLEAERNVNKTKIESRFSASLNASIGFNQVSEKFKDVYRKPLEQDLVSVSVSIPLIDWGVRKGKYNMAKNNLNVVRIAARQEELSLEEEVTMTVGDFNIQQRLIASAEEALDLAVMAYEQTRQRFIIGKADVNSLTLSLNRQQEAQKNYISALQNYWLNYYKIRRLTLHDFESGL